MKLATGCQAEPEKKAAPESSAATSRPMRSVLGVGTGSPAARCCAADTAYTPDAYSSCPKNTPMEAPRPVRK
jgi:hypothetical protein